MPHLILEHSELAAPFDHRALFGELHGVLERTGEFKLDQMRSRAVARVWEFGVGGRLDVR